MNTPTTPSLLELLRCLCLDANDGRFPRRDGYGAQHSTQHIEPAHDFRCTLRLHAADGGLRHYPRCHDEEPS